MEQLFAEGTAALETAITKFETLKNQMGSNGRMVATLTSQLEVSSAYAEKVGRIHGLNVTPVAVITEVAPVAPVAPEPVVEEVVTEPVGKKSRSKKLR
jgi:hypothetical protein